MSKIDFARLVYESCMEDAAGTDMYKSGEAYFRGLLDGKISMLHGLRMIDDEQYAAYKQLRKSGGACV